MKFLVLAFLITVSVLNASSQQSDSQLRRIQAADAAARSTDGSLPTLDLSEHMLRAETYSTNRLFPEARSHWHKVIDLYPTDPAVAKALFGIARSFMWERKYSDAVIWFNRLIKDFPMTKDGREGLSFKGASLVRLGKNIEAAKTYEQYLTMFPTGERIESAHLNIIDAYREAGKYEDAVKWSEATITRFRAKPAEVNALHARLRMEIHREKWAAAVAVANSLLTGLNFSGSMASADEVKFLRAFALEQMKSPDAKQMYLSIPNSIDSYYGGIAAEKVGLQSRPKLNASQYPIVFRTELLSAAKKYRIDPRFLLAVMKQESSFRTNAKSPAGARGLLQLVYDTAIKYNQKAGYPKFQPDDLYKPSVNIAIGSAYVRDLKSEFGGLYEAVAAGYNAGEDNSLRWLNRSRPKDPGIFTSEVGFAETKNYVFKVMNNYRAYKLLYSESLVPR